MGAALAATSRRLGGPLTRMLGDGTLIAGTLGGGDDQPTSRSASSSSRRLLFGGGGSGTRFAGGLIDLPAAFGGAGFAAGGGGAFAAGFGGGGAGAFGGGAAGGFAAEGFGGGGGAFAVRLVSATGRFECAMIIPLRRR
jgi:hypothetical protein